MAPYRAAAQAQSERALARALRQADLTPCRATSWGRRRIVLRWLGVGSAAALIVVVALLAGRYTSSDAGSSVLYVDFSASESGMGTPEAPFRRLSDAVQSLDEQTATVRLAPGSSPEGSIRIEKGLRLEAMGGRVLLGKSGPFPEKETGAPKPVR
jgi:hypothetical protein